LFFRDPYRVTTTKLLPSSISRKKTLLQLMQLTTAPSPASRLDHLPQEILVSFKNAYDILSDPVQWQAYDDLGHTGIAFVK
jgi:hypothetical protein